MSSLFLSTPLFRGVASVVLSLTLFACVIEEGPPRRLSPRGSTPTEGSTGGVGSTPPPASTGGTTTDTPPATSTPMLVEIDTGEVMNAEPGQGVGIFTEYKEGGLWHVWWTCDTAQSSQACDVALAATVTTGTFSEVDDQALGDNHTLSKPSPSRIEAGVRTTTEVHGLTFRTDAGAILTLEASVGGLREGPGVNRSFFFFVQDGKINGGYTGALTNPLQFQGRTP